MSCRSDRFIDSIARASALAELAEVDAPQAELRRAGPRRAQPGAARVTAVVPQQVAAQRGTFLPDAPPPAHGPARLGPMAKHKSAWQLAAQPHALDLH
jgi:hypothetical protein